MGPSGPVADREQLGRLRVLPAVRAAGRQLGRAAESAAWLLHSGELIRSGEEVPLWAVVSAGLAPVVLTVAWLLADSVQPRAYNPIRDTVSVLAGFDGTDRWIMTCGLLVICACYLVTAVGLAGVALPARLLLLVAGLCAAGIAASPDQSSGPTNAHLAWTTLGGITIAIWPAVAGYHLPERPLVLKARSSAVVTMLFIALLGWVLLETRGGSELGLAERLDSGIQTCWPFVVALVLRHGTRDRTRTESVRRGDHRAGHGGDEDWPSGPACRC